MKKEELLNIEFDGQSDLIAGLCDFFEFKKASNSEKENWPYNNKLIVSIDNIIGKELYNRGEFIGIVEDCYFGKGPRGHSAVLIKSKEQEYSLTESKVKVYNKFSEEEELIDLHPSRKGVKFWSNGHILSEKHYKSLYYKTREYRSQYEKTLNENLGTTGLTAPIQSKQIKDKISNTMEDRYGVNWFLERGSHYSAVTMTMQDKFGVDNLFYSYEWQLQNSKNVNKNLGESSKLEREIISELEEVGLSKSFHYNSDSGQKIIVVNKRKFYKLDYYNEESNVVIEIMGDYWHCNPNIYSHDFYHKNKKKLASKIWIDDRKRKNEIINIINCSYIEVWESDWKNNKENVLKYIKSQIEANKL